jgi:hypothetical protein
MRRLLSFIILLISATTLAQELPDARLFDEFGKLNCEDLLARVDSFENHLEKDPTATGVVLLESPRKGRDHSPYYRLMIQKSMQRRGFPSERLRFYRRPGAELSGALWVVLPGSKIAFPNYEEWPDAPLDLSRAFVWDTDEDVDSCPTFAPGAFAELLKTHTELRGHIVVNADTRRHSIATGAYWIKELTGRWGIPRDRLKLFVGKRNKVWFSTEFWIVPTKSK